MNLLKEWVERDSFMGDMEEENFGPEVNKMKGDKGYIEMNEPLETHQKEQLRKLEKEFSDVFSNKPGNTHLIEHSIQTPADIIVWDQGRALPRHLIPVKNKEVQEMLKLGVIEPSFSPLRSHLVVVPKPDDTIRCCIDFRKLNAVSKFDAYPMPRIDDLLEKLGESKY